MINIGTEKTVDKKAMVKRMIPLFVVAIVFLIVWFLFINVYSNGKLFQLSTLPTYQNQEEVRIEKLIEFINSDSFNDLIFTPNPSLFNEASGSFKSGKSNPFLGN